MGVKIKYAEQKEAIGSSDALRQAKDHISHDSFFMIYGDDIYDKSFFEKISSKQYAAIGMKVKNWKIYGIFQLKDGLHLDKIVEKPDMFVGDLANIGVFKVDKAIFDYTDKVEKSVRNEFEVTDVVSFYTKDHPMEIIEVESGWMPLGYPWHLLEATEEILKHIKSENNGTIESGATVKGNVVIGEGTVVKAGAYIEGNFVIGKNSIIGPNCSLRNYGSIGDNTVIGNAVELKEVIVGNNTKMKHLTYIGDSIIGNNVNIAGGTMVADLRHDDASVKMMINDKLVDSGRRKLGAVIGDNVKTGMNTSVFPGRKIWNNVWTMPGEVVDKDKKETTLP
jgi:bifunctional UDP-N-acetylglucosamine pyrophosphorylase/glucosamine-1-phosphate N-acetyltransferase